MRTCHAASYGTAGRDSSSPASEFSIPASLDCPSQPAVGEQLTSASSLAVERRSAHRLTHSPRSHPASERCCGRLARQALTSDRSFVLGVTRARLADRPRPRPTARRNHLETQRVCRRLQSQLCPVDSAASPLSLIPHRHRSCSISRFRNPLSHPPTSWRAT